MRVDVETLKIECCVGPGASVRADVPPEDPKDYYSDAPPRGTIPILGSRVDTDKIRFSPMYRRKEGCQRIRGSFPRQGRTEGTEA